MDKNNFDISSITDIQGSTYNYENGTMTLIDQDDQEFNFEIIKKVIEEEDGDTVFCYAIKYNNEEIGTIYSGTRKIVLGDKEFSLLSVFNTTNGTATLLKPEDLNINSVLDMPLEATENYFNIYDGNGNYIQLFYNTNNVNEDGSYNLVDLNYTTDSEGNINAENIVGSFIKENDKVQEIKIMHSDGAGYNIHKEINGTFYKLTSPTLPGLQNIKSATIAEDSISITTANNEILDCDIVSITGNANMCYIQYEGKNIAIYNIETKEIISAGQNNSINLANNSRFTPTVDGNSYVNLQQLEVNSLSYNTNSTPPTITLNDYEFKLEPISGYSNQYKIVGIEESYFYPTASKFYMYNQSFSYAINNGQLYKFPYYDDSIIYLDNIKSFSINEESLTVTIDNIPYTLEPLNNSSNLYYLTYIDNYGITRYSAIYNSSNNEIISFGENNSINFTNNSKFTQTVDENVYINLQKLDITHYHTI